MCSTAYEVRKLSATMLPSGGAKRQKRVSMPSKETPKKLAMKMLRTMVAAGEDEGLAPKELWESRAAFRVLDLKQFRDTLGRYRRENAAAIQCTYHFIVSLLSSF